MLTFKATLALLKEVEVSFFVLENVDMDEGGKGDPEKSNLALILKALQNASSSGFTTHAFVCLSSDFGLPQRRERLYIVGANKSMFPSFDVRKVQRLLSSFKLPCQPPDSLL